jgi:hypothetical protein
MPDPSLFQTIQCSLSIDVVAMRPEFVQVTVMCELPGVEHYEHTFRGSPLVPEEAFSLYDDATHAMKAWSSCLALALEDLLLHQPQLF